MVGAGKNENNDKEFLCLGYGRKLEEVLVRGKVINLVLDLGIKNLFFYVWLFKEVRIFFFFLV